MDDTNTTGNNDRSIKDLPQTTLLECPAPQTNPKSPTYPSYGINVEDLPVTAKLRDFAWLLGRSLTCCPADDADGEMTQSQLPVWSGYNSLLYEKQPLTRIGCPPLLAAPAHEWTTMLTILMQV